MNAYANKNGVKLLAMIMVLAMIATGAAIALSDESVDAAPVKESSFIEDVSDGNYELKGDTEVTVANTITKTDTGALNISLAEGVTAATLTLTMNAVEGANTGKQMFNGIDITVESGVTLKLVVNAVSAVDNAKILVNGGLTINGGTVIFNQAANAAGQSWWNNTAETLDINNNGKFIIDGANGFSGVIADVEKGSSIEFKSTTSANGAAMNFAEGSKFYNGSTVTVSDSNAFLYFEGDATINGTIDASSSRMVITSTATVTFNANAKVSVESIETEGNVNIVEGAVVSGTYEVTGLDTAKTLLESVDEVTLDYTKQDLSLDSDFTIPVGKTLNIVNGTTINSTNDAIFIVSGTLNLDGAYLYAGVYIDEEAGGLVNAINVHNLTSTGDLQNSTKVGYGDTLTLSGTVSSNLSLEIYGTMNVEDVTINGTVEAFVGSVINVTGSITVSNSFILNAGASMELSGTISVRNDANGGANFTLAENKQIDLPALTTGGSARIETLAATMTVTENGTFNVNRPTSNSASGVNSLVVSNGAQFIVEGTLTITGNLSGTIQDKGTVTFNGTVASDTQAGIVIYDGVSLSITSVTGTITVSDSNNVVYDYLGVSGSADLASGIYISTGNSVELTNVRGVTVAVTVEESYNDDNTERYYVTNMAVSGSVSKIQTASTGTVQFDNSSVTNANTSDEDSPKATMSIVDTFAVGTDVVAINVANSEITVSGEVSVIAQDSTMTNNGTITVTGMITVDDEASFTQGTINAAYYRITASDATYTDYYTSFANAVDNIADADDDTVTIYGVVTADADAEIPNGANVTVQGTLIIDIEATVTVADGAVLNITGTLVDVDGTLIITNNNNGLSGNVNNMEYDVKKNSGSTDTYTSLARALSDAVAGETITLSQPVTLDSSITIPADVTLQTGRYTITVNDGVTITVNGTLAIQSNGNIVPGVDSESKAYVWGDDIRIVVSGVVSDASNLVEDLSGYHISGAYFTSRNVDYVTGVAYAAENVHEGIITVYGQVSMGDVEFTAADNRDLNVKIDEISKAGTNGIPETVVSAGTVTIGQNVTVTLTAGSFTGTVASTINGETSAVEFSRASGVNVNAGTVNSASGSTEYYYLSGSASTFNGDVTITTGIVTAGTSITATGENCMTVASGATFVIPTGSTLTAGISADIAKKNVALVVEGTMNVAGDVDIGGIASITGTMTIAKNNGGNATVDVTGTMNVTGTVTISSEEDNAGVLNLNSGTLVVGSKPRLLGTEATGTVSGPVTVTNSTIKVYNGASIDDITIGGTTIADVNSIDSTAYYINDTLYMTVFTNAANANIVATIGQDVVGNVGLQLTGLNTTGVGIAGNWYVDSELTTPMTADAKIGSYEAVYYEAPVANVTGTISAGTGLVIYIDGVAQNNDNDAQIGYGSHIITIDVKVGYDASNATITYNGQTISSGDTIEITENGFVLTATGATPADLSGGSSSGSSDGMGLTDYLLIILVILIVIMAIMVAMRLMRS